MTIETLGHKGGEVRFRLRAATDGLHRQTEQIFALDRRISTRAGYRGLLARLYGYYAPAERGLAAVAWPAALRMDVRLRKADWLAEDLETLGLAKGEIEDLPRCREIGAPRSVAEGLGMLYVLEGATLGGQLIERRLRERLDVGPENGGRFFTSYAAQIGPMWRVFVAELDTSAHAAPIIEQAAIATFETFGGWLGHLDRP